MQAGGCHVTEENTVERNPMIPKAELRKYKDLLETEQLALSGGLRLRDRIVVPRLPEFEEEAQLITEQDLAVLNCDREAGVLRRIREALDRIESGGYGCCLACGEDIPRQRLKAVPWTAYCLRCQETLDQPETTGGDGSLWKSAA